MKTKGLALYIFASVIVIGFFALLYILIFTEIPEGNRDVLNLVIGSLIGSFTSVVAYYFGSSKGSADKNKLIRTQENGKS